jgi:hypothetical protein
MDRLNPGPSHSIPEVALEAEISSYSGIDSISRCSVAVPVVLTDSIDFFDNDSFKLGERSIKDEASFETGAAALADSLLSSRGRIISSSFF